MTSPRNVDDLIDQINRVQQDMDWYNNLSKFFPTPSTIRLIKIVHKIKKKFEEIPSDQWKLIVAFWNCDARALNGLGKDKLIAFAEVLRLNLELRSASLVVPGTEGNQIKDYLDNHHKDLEERIRNAQTDDIARDALMEMKRVLKVDYKPLWLLFIAVYNEDLAKEIAKAGSTGLRAKAGKAIKTILKKVITKIIVKKAAKETAKKLIPYVGVFLTLSEAIGYGVVLDEIKRLDELLNRLLCKLVDYYVSLGREWPLHYKSIWVKPRTLLKGKFKSGFLSWKNYIQCCSEDEEKGCVCGEKCLLTFNGGFREAVKAIPIDLAEARYDITTKTWYFRNDIDRLMVDQSPCKKNTKNPKKCIIATEVTATTFSKEKPRKVFRHKKYIINTAKAFT